MSLSTMLFLIACVPCAQCILCKCNQAFRQANDRLGKTGLEAAIGNCTSEMFCEVSVERCNRSIQCRQMMTMLRQKLTMHPSCLFEIDGMQGCHWFGSDAVERCDSTRGPFRGSEPNYRCRTGHFCNNLSNGQARRKCARLVQV